MSLKDSENEDIVVYSTIWCPDCKRAKKFFSDHRIPYTNIDIENDPEAMAFVEKVNKGMRVVPTIIFADGSILTEPSNAELAEELGLKTKASHDSYETVIVGGGPCGLTAALYLAREGVDVLVIEKSGLGGQVAVTQVLDNFPGFPKGISGAEFANRLVEQAHRFGVETLQAQEVTGVNKEGQYLCVRTADGSEYTARSVLFTTGAMYRKLGVPGEDELIGSSIHFCATCDGAFYKDEKVLVVGGGNSGFEEGIFLTRFARQVDIVEFLPQVNASRILQDKVAGIPGMTVVVNHAVKEFKGEHRLESVLVEDRATGEIHEWEYDGVFIFIGLMPNSDTLKDRVEIDKYGFITTDQTLMTAVPGLFAAGDVRAGSTKQAASAAGEGATAALMIRDYLNKTV